MLLLGWLCDLWRAASLADELLEAGFTHSHCYDLQQQVASAMRQKHLEGLKCAMPNRGDAGHKCKVLGVHPYGPKCVDFHLILA